MKTKLENTVELLSDLGTELLQIDFEPRDDATSEEWRDYGLNLAGKLVKAENVVNRHLMKVQELDITSLIALARIVKSLGQTNVDAVHCEDVADQLAETCQHPQGPNHAELAPQTEVMAWKAIVLLRQIAKAIT